MICGVPGLKGLAIPNLFIFKKLASSTVESMVSLAAMLVWHGGIT
jgi:hypothetical protein